MDKIQYGLFFHKLVLLTVKNYLNEVTVPDNKNFEELVIIKKALEEYQEKIEFSKKEQTVMDEFSNLLASELTKNMTINRIIFALEILSFYLAFFPKKDRANIHISDSRVKNAKGFYLADFTKGNDAELVCEQSKEVAKNYFYLMEARLGGHDD